MPTVFTILLSLLSGLQSQLPTLRSAIPPAAPVTTPFAGVVVLIAQAGANGDVQSVSALAGPQPFLNSSVAALRKWKWTSVTGETNSPGIPSLTELAESAVQRWKFTPARNGGNLATGTVIVAISFLRPITH